MVLVPFTATGAKRFLTKRRSAAAIGHWVVLVVPTADMGFGLFGQDHLTAMWTTT